VVTAVCVCLSVCLFLAACPHYCTDPGITWGIVGVPPSCVLLGGFAIGAHDNIAPNVKCQQVLVLALSLVVIIMIMIRVLLPLLFNHHHNRRRCRRHYCCSIPHKLYLDLSSTYETWRVSITIQLQVHYASIKLLKKLQSMSTLNSLRSPKGAKMHGFQEVNGEKIYGTEKCWSLTLSCSQA